VAVQAILKARDEGGKFETLADMCQRVDGRTVNRKILEGLIKSGACDCFGETRATLFASIDRVMGRAASAASDKAKGQVSLFGMFEEKAETKDDGLIRMAEWPQSELLAHEKELLGFYITGHPLDKYEGRLARLTSGSISGLRENPVNGEVKAGGVVTAMRLRNTKKGERYASFQLEDRSGFIEVIVWPDTYRRCMEMLVLDDPILVSGKMDVGEERVQIIANGVVPLEQAAQQLPPAPARKKDNGQRIHFYVVSPNVTSEEFVRLHAMLRRYPGTCPVFLHLRKPDQSETVIELPEDLRVASNPELLQTVEQLFGSRVTVSPLPS